MPGRGAQLSDMDERLSYMIDLRRLVGRVRVDVAPRGLGKTSLLREAQRHADGRGALTIWLTAGEELGLVTSIGEEIHRRTETWASETRGGDGSSSERKSWAKECLCRSCERSARPSRRVLRTLRSLGYS